MTTTTPPPGHPDHDSDIGPVDPPVPYLSITEFADLGGILEVNRRLLHPRGLALEWDPGDDYDQAQTILDRIAVAIEDKCGIDGAQDALAAIEPILRDLCKPAGEAYLSGVWDDRSDPLGTRYALAPESVELAGERAARFAAMGLARGKARFDALGYPMGVQPLSQLGDPA